MKNITSTILFIFLAVLSFAQGDVSKARSINQGIVIDGKDNDWAQPLNFYDEKTGMMYAVGNDKSDLYFCFTTNDDLKMRKMMNAGWKLELVSKEKKKKFKSEIDIPGVNMSGIGRMVAAANIINIYKSNISSIPVKGFKSGKDEIKLNDASDIDVAIGMDSTKHVVYEIAVPLRDLYDAQKINFNELITLEVKVNGLEKPNFSVNTGGGMSGRMGGGGRPGGYGGGMGGGRSGMGRMGGGGHFGGGMERGGAGVRSGTMNSMFESTSFKQKISLAGI
jgi:hypothetical protein